MACFLVPATTAIISTSVKKKINPKYRLEWLNTLLWGGTVMLAVEHIARKEITLYPPFLTAMKNPADIPMVLQEIATVGVAMTAAIILTWTAMILIANKTANAQKKRALKTATA